MDIKITCPLGSECETIIDNQLNRCAWYTEMAGKDASGKEHNDWRCAMAWQPILQVEMSQTNRTVAASVQSMRNEQIKRQDLALQAFSIMQPAEIQHGDSKVIKSQ